MKRTFSCFLLAIVALLTFTQCDDNTGSVGSTLVPDNDMITAETKTFHATSNTIMANDSILANTSDVYLGMYTDEESGTVFSSSFVTQFGCTEDFEFPMEGVVGDTASCLKTEFSVTNCVATSCLTGHSASLYSSVLNTLWH